MLFDYAAHIKYSFLSGILKDLKFWIKSKIINDLIEDFKYKGLQYSSAHWLPTVTQDLKYEYSLNGKQDLKFWSFFDGLQYLKYLIISWYKFLLVLNSATPTVRVLMTPATQWASLIMLSYCLWKHFFMAHQHKLHNHPFWYAVGQFQANICYLI